MKKMIYTLMFLAIASMANAQWVQMSNGIGTSQTVWSLASNGNNIFAGTGLYPNYTGVYLSTNNGVNWDQTALNNREIFALATLGNNIFAGTGNSPVGTGGVYLSTNNGANWTQTGLNYHTIRSLAILGTTVFTGTMDSGVYRSTNNGTNWILTSLNNQDVLNLAVNGINIFAGTYISASVYTSTDNGANWTQAVVNSEAIISLAVSGNNIFAGSNGNGVYLSTNNGTNWTQAGLSGQSISALAAVGNNIFAGGSSSVGIYFSSNNGTSWASINQGFPAYPNLHTLLITNNYIYAGTSSYSVWRRPLSEFTSIKNTSNEIPDKYILSQNFPNPFNPSTNISYELPTNGFVKLIVFDVRGLEVETLVNENQSAGTYSLDWSASLFPSGVYFYRLTVDGFSETKKMILIR